MMQIILILLLGSYPTPLFVHSIPDAYVIYENEEKHLILDTKCIDMSIVQDLIKSRLVYKTEIKSQADKVVYISRFKHEATLIVYESTLRAEAAQQKGIWYWTMIKPEADWQIYFTKYKSEADIIVYFTKFKHEATSQ